MFPVVLCLALATAVVVASHTLTDVAVTAGCEAFNVDTSHSRSCLGNLLAVNPATRMINTLTVPRTLVVSAVRAGPSMFDLDGEPAKSCDACVVF